VIAVAIELFREFQDLGRAKFNAKAATLTGVPVDEDLTTKLATSWRRRALRHVNLDE
jgi:hypothetical protein